MWTDETAVLIVPSSNVAASNLGTVFSIFPRLFLQPDIWEMVLEFYYYCLEMKIPNCSQVDRFISVLCSRSNLGMRSDPPPGSS